MKNVSKFILISTIVCLGLGAAMFSFAQENTSASADEQISASDLGVQDPFLLPDSPFYFLKTWGQKIKLALTFNNVKKAKLENNYANEKLVELKKLAEKNASSGVIKKAAERYQNAVDKIKERADKIKDKAETNPEVNKFLEKFEKQQVLQEKILQKLETQAPQDVSEKIRQARENHLEKFSQVMQKLEDRCPTEYAPVCGKDGKTYSNACVVKNSNAEIAYKGECGQNPGTDCKELWWFDIYNRNCQQKKFCGIYIYESLETFSTKDECQKELANASKKNTNCIPEGGTGERRADTVKNYCCPGLEEKPVAMTQSIPGSILFKCTKPADKVNK